MAQLVKNPPAMLETWVRVLCGGMDTLVQALSSPLPVPTLCYMGIPPLPILPSGTCLTLKCGPGTLGSLFPTFHRLSAEAFPLPLQSLGALPSPVQGGHPSQSRFYPFPFEVFPPARA